LKQSARKEGNSVPHHQELMNLDTQLLGRNVYPLEML
jgi:hypothetical protein